MKTILTVIGQDRTGIIAGVSQRLFELNINILDVNQTIMDKYFTMIMLLDFSESSVAFDDAHQQIKEIGDKLKVKVNLQREEIFEAMHRL